MSAPLEIIAYPGINEDLVARVRDWAGEVLKKTEDRALPSRVYLTLWKTNKELQDFYQREQETLGVAGGQEADYLASHEAWRGVPRIHLSQERIKGLPEAIVQGVLQHEIVHALLHGRPEFYTFRFTEVLQEAGRVRGLELPHLQQCVYFLSVAVKDREVVGWLAARGFAPGQLALLEFTLEDTEEDRQAWTLAHETPALRRIALAAFLKVLLPIEALISKGSPGARKVKKRWQEAYGWLGERIQEELSRFARSLEDLEELTFQNKLEQTALRWMAAG